MRRRRFYTHIASICQPLRVNDGARKGIRRRNPTANILKNFVLECWDNRSLIRLRLKLSVVISHDPWCGQEERADALMRLPFQELGRLEGVLQSELEEARIRSITREGARSGDLTAARRDTRIVGITVGGSIEQVEDVRTELQVLLAVGREGFEKRHVDAVIAGAIGLAARAADIRKRRCSCHYVRNRLM